MKSWEHLLNLRQAIKGLKTISEKADPASGVSFSVRRGVSRDNDNVEGDEINRPWVTVELSDLTSAIAALEHIIKAMEGSERIWQSAVAKDITDARKALESR